MVIYTTYDAQDFFIACQKTSLLLSTMKSYVKPRYCFSYSIKLQNFYIHEKFNNTQQVSLPTTLSLSYTQNKHKQGHKYIHYINLKCRGKTKEETRQYAKHKTALKIAGDGGEMHLCPSFILIRASETLLLQNTTSTINIPVLILVFSKFRPSFFYQFREMTTQ